MQNISFRLLNRPIWNFIFTLELFIDNLKVSNEFETSDLDFQGQICYESFDVCVITCECDNF